MDRRSTVTFAGISGCAQLQSNSIYNPIRAKAHAVCLPLEDDVHRMDDAWYVAKQCQ